MSSFPTVFSARLDNSLSFSSNLKLSSAISLNLDQSQIFVWERVNSLHTAEDSKFHQDLCTAVNSESFGQDSRDLVRID